MTISVGVYVRISEDTALTGLGVARQREDCSKLAQTKGWSVVKVYEDNDVSATSGKPRPAYLQMLADVREGLIKGVVVWDVDRLTRTPAELESFIDLANAFSLELASVGGEIDLATPQGRLTARIKGAVARHEVEQASRRIRRKNQERAEAGLPHGTPAWGWDRIDGSDVLDPGKALVIQEVCKRLVAGDTLSTIAADLNKRGVEGPGGREWNRRSLRGMVLRPRNAGLREHQGQVIGEAAWDAAVDKDTWERACAVLSDPTRRNKPGPRVESLLSGLARCGICNAKMTSVLRRTRSESQRALVCQGCGGTIRKQVDVESFVEYQVVQHLLEHSAAELFAKQGSDPELALKALEALRARKREAATMFAEGDIDGAQLKAINERLAPELAVAEEAYAETLAAPDIAELAGPEAAEKWDALTTERRRRVIEYMTRVTLRPTKHTGYYRRVFDPTTVFVEWLV